jgi:hypothetical protein
MAGEDECDSSASRETCGEIAKPYPVVIACDKRGAFAQWSEATKQSNFLCRSMDCFAEPVIGRAFARPVGSQ